MVNEGDISKYCVDNRHITEYSHRLRINIQIDEPKHQMRMLKSCFFIYLIWIINMRRNYCYQVLGASFDSFD